MTGDNDDIENEIKDKRQLEGNLTSIIPSI